MRSMLRRTKIKGHSPVIPVILIVLVLGGLFYFDLLPFGPGYPTGYEVATKFDGAQYNQYTFPYVVPTDYPDSQRPDLTAGTIWYDPDVRDYGFPDAWAQIGQPMHVKYSEGKYIACDDSVYTQRIERLFWSPDKKTVVKHVMDLHHYMFTIDMRTYGDWSCNHDKNKYRAEATWDDWKKSYFDMKAMDGEIRFEVIFSVKAQSWQYSVSPAVGELEGWSAEKAGVWSGILGVRVVDHPLFKADGEANKIGWKGEVGLINAQNDPVDLGRKDWYKAGRAWVSRTVGKNVYISPQELAFNEGYIRETGLNLPQEYTGMKVGMIGETGLSVQWHDRIGDDAIWDMWIQDIGVSYCLVADVVVDQGWTLAAPVDTITEPPAEEEEEEEEEERPGGLWGGIKGAAGAVKGWVGNRWGEVKDVGGFFGDIIEGIIDLMMAVFWIILIVIGVVVIFVVFSVARGAIKGKKRR